MTAIVERHVSGLGEGETPEFRLQPLGSVPSEAVYLDPDEIRILTSLLVNLTLETRPNWPELRRTILTSFYQGKTRRR